MSRYLLLGDRGMLGRAFHELLRSRGDEVDGLDLPALDIANEDQVNAIVTPDYAAVINCAAYTNVDGAEEHEAAATRVNGDGPGVLARACAREGLPLVHFSTDYVFAGNARAPYRVDQAREPLNAYGRSKAKGEEAIAAAFGPHLILRTSWLYAPWANNFVRTMERLSRERTELKVVDDQRGRPTSAQELAQVTLELLAKGARGILHATDGGECTWFGLASEVVRLAGHPCRVLPCTTAEFPRPARRPAYSVLDIAPTEAVLGRPLRPWQEALARVMEQLE